MSGRRLVGGDAFIHDDSNVGCVDEGLESHEGRGMSGRKSRDSNIENKYMCGIVRSKWRE